MPLACSPVPTAQLVFEGESTCGGIFMTGGKIWNCSETTLFLSVSFPPSCLGNEVGVGMQDVFARAAGCEELSWWV